MEIKLLQDNLTVLRSFTNPSLWCTMDLLEKTYTYKDFTYRGYREYLKMLKEPKTYFHSFSISAR